MDKAINENAIIDPGKNFSALRIIMNLRQSVKNITHHANKVYLTALNAMFMARRISSRTIAYTRVTTELRRFSRQMDVHMKELSTLCSKITYQIADHNKKTKLAKKITLALQMTRVSNSKRVVELRKIYE